jgi:hypothetical protein
MQHRSMRAGEKPRSPVFGELGSEKVRRQETMNEMEEGKQKFLEVVKEIDETVQVVIPVTPSNSMFLISLTKGPNRKFITVPEDDIIDLPREVSIRTKVTKTVKDAIGSL